MVSGRGSDPVGSRSLKRPWPPALRSLRHGALPFYTYQRTSDERPALVQRSSSVLAALTKSEVHTARLDLPSLGPAARIATTMSQARKPFGNFCLVTSVVNSTSRGTQPVGVASRPDPGPSADQ